MRQKIKINLFVRRYNPMVRRVVSEFWGSTTWHRRCRTAAASVWRGIPGPSGITAQTTDRVFARFDRKQPLNVWMYASVCSYLIVVAVVFAGMILTPTRSSREVDQRTRERLGGAMNEIDYLAVKVFVALFWPWFWVRSFFK